MRTLIYIILSLLVGVFNSQAQEEPSADTTENEVSFSFDGDLSFSGNENMYFSTSNSDDTYKVRAKFPARKTKKIRAYLKEELGEKNMKKSGSKQQWKMEYSGDTSYEIKVDEGSLRIFVNKELVSSSLFNKLKTITKREEERIEREAEQLLREAEQKIREAEQLQREAERLKREALRKTE